MWAIVKNQEDNFFAQIQHGSTLGSAQSNTIVLPSKFSKALEGQIKLTTQGLAFRNLNTNTIQDLKSGAVLQFGEVSVQFIDDQAHRRDFLLIVERAWKRVLNQMPSAGFEQTIEALLRGPFRRFPPHSDVIEFLRSQFDEYSLSGPVERLLSDSDASDILIQSHDSIWVERNGVLNPVDIHFSTEDAYKIYIENLLADQGVAWDESHPFVDFKLKGGERAHLIGPPLSQSFCLSIRKPRHSALSLRELQEREMFDEHALKILIDLIHDGKNILVAGATGSGKTTLLKAILLEIPRTVRTLVLEDTPELELPLPNLVFLKTRIQARSELPSIDLKQLVRQSLRMRPDRIVIGEVRGGEAMDLLHAMNTGHRGSMASLHANSCRDALFRLEGLVQMSDSRLSESIIRDVIARNVHILIYCGKNREGRRRVEEVCVVRGKDRDQIMLEILYENKT